MNEIKCPNCGTVFKIDEKQYDSIVKQVRDSEFKNEIATRQEQYEKDKNQAIKLAENELEKKLSTMLKEKDLEITKLNEELKSKKQLEDSLVENTKIKTANEYKEEIAKLNIKIKELENEKAMDHCLSYRNSRGKCTGTTTQQVSLSGHEINCGTTGGRFTSTPHIRRKSGVDAKQLTGYSPAWH